MPKNPRIPRTKLPHGMIDADAVSTSDEQILDAAWASITDADIEESMAVLQEPPKKPPKRTA